MLRAVPPDMIGRPSEPFPDPYPEELKVVDENARIAREFIPDQPWAQDATLQFRDGRQRQIDSERDKGGLYYYAQEWAQTNEKRSVEFKPLALVWFQKEAKEPLVILADSAVVTFQRDVDLSSPDPGRIIAGELLGRVTIRGPEGLLVDGERFIFSEESGSIFSDSPVEFAWQSHQGRAEQGIQLDLEMTPHGAESQLAVTSVRQVHLFRNVEMNFLFEQDDDVIPLSVFCAGRFMLRMLGRPENPASRSIATFEDRVVVRRATEFNTADVLTCDQLDLHLEEGLESAEDNGLPFGIAQNPDVPRPLPGAVPAGAKNRIQFRRMRASGFQIRLTSQINELEAVIRSNDDQSRAPAIVDYDARERRLILNDFDPGTAAQWKPRVHITQTNAEIDCQQVELTHHPDGRINDVICRGNGWLAYRKAPTSGAAVEDVLLANWKRQLRRFTDNTTGQDVIDLYGDAVVRLPENRSGISAEYIKVWTDPLQTADSQQPTVGGATGRDEMAENVPALRRVLAQQNVILASPQLQGQMKELQVWFEDAPPGAESGDQSQKLRPVSYRVAESPLLLPDPDDATDEPLEPIAVTADLTRVRIIRRGEDVQPEVREVWTEGDVHITHQRPKNAGTVELTGNRLHIINKGETDQVMHLFGEPAQILDPDMRLTGHEIFFDRRRNVAWSDGSGELKLPAKRDFDGKPLETPTELTINWHEQMQFDGRVASFIGRVHASLFDSVMRCQQMEVTLAKPLSFVEGTHQAERPEIATVTCQFDVEFNSHVIEEGALREVRRAKFARFHLNQQTGEIRADNGPGTVSLWRRGRGKRAGLAPIAAVGANKAANTESTEWEFSRIQFAQDMIGSVHDRTTKFRGQIEIIYGPVDEPLETVSLDSLPKDGGAMFCDWLEFVQRETSDKRKHVELLGKGNSRLEGRSFFGQADEISFDESKGLYMLRSAGNESILWREKVAGGERTAVVAETFRFIPSRNFVDFDKATRVQGLQ